MRDIKEELQKEHSELEEKVDKIHLFLVDFDNAIKVAGEEQVNLLMTQSSAMDIYLSILEMRINALGNE